MSFLHFSSIRGRLFLAFGSVAAMTVLATSIAWISFGGVGDSLKKIVKYNIPTVMLAASLAEKSAVITATAPALAAAESEFERARTWLILSENLNDIRNLLEEVDVIVLGHKSKSSILSMIDGLRANLSALDTNVRKQFWFRERNADLVDRLRWTHTDFLDEVEPMIEDARFRIELAVDSAQSSDEKIVKNLRLSLETQRQAALLRLNATGNLAVGLIARAASLPDSTSLNDTSLFLSEVQGRAISDINKLKALPESLSLSQSLQDVMAFASGDNDLFQLRRDELTTLRDGQELVSINQELVRRLQDFITELVEAGKISSIEAASQSETSIENGKLMLLTVAGFSLIFAVLVVWLYVGRNLVRRITLLDENMRNIAEGDLNTHVFTEGNDEISEMAHSLRKFRDTLAETQAELVQAGKLAALGQLAAGVAHELNQPLAAIRSYAYNTNRLMDKQEMEDARVALNRISGLVERMAGTVNHLRNLARRPTKQLEAIDLGKVCSDALQLLEERIREEGVHISFEIEPRVWQVKAEAIRLEQVFINLVGNAIDAMAGTNNPRLVISAKEIEDKILIFVKDSGTGIKNENLAHIFDPFFTTKSPGEGVGLGLSISYNIIKDFGGSISVTSLTGEMTTFMITLIRADQ